MKVTAVAAIFLCFFIVCSAQDVKVNCEPQPSAPVRSCIERLAGAETDAQRRSFCSDCRTSVLDYINGATCPKGSADEFRKGKSLYLWCINCMMLLQPIL